VKGQVLRAGASSPEVTAGVSGIGSGKGTSSMGGIVGLISTLPFQLIPDEFQHQQQSWETSGKNFSAEPGGTCVVKLSPHKKC